MTPFYPCNKCLHFHGSPLGSIYATCQALTYQNPVTGDLEPAYCTVARAAMAKCGPEANLWEPNSDTQAELAEDERKIRTILQDAAASGKPWGYDPADIDALRAEYGDTLLHEVELHDLIIDFIPYEPCDPDDEPKGKASHA